MRFTGRLFSKAVDMAYVYSGRENRFIKFKESIVEFLGSQTNVAKFTFEQKMEKIIVDHDGANSEELVLGRAPYCPFSSKNMLEYSWDERPENIPVACSCIIESPVPGAGILLTRRAGHLRTFPRLWVPPGGHIDQDETLDVAIRREVEEEIGLSSNEQHGLLMPNFVPIAGWESAFPGAAIPGIAPKRHHLVIYYLARFKPDYDTALPLLDLNLQENEVTAAAWLTRNQVKLLVDDAENCDYLFQMCDMTDLMRIGRYVREALSSRGSVLEQSKHTPIKAMQDPLWEKCLEFPGNDTSQVWYWHTSVKRWMQRPFTELFHGMLSGFNSPQRSPERPPSAGEFLPSPPSRCSIGTVFAMKAWLERSN